MDYSGINAKIKAMKGELFKTDDYENLIDLKSVADLVHYLKGVSEYEKALASVSDDDIHRGNVEQKILFSLHNDYSKIYTFISNHKIRRFLQAFFLKHEIYVLKLVLCSIYDERDIEYTPEELLIYLGQQNKFDVHALLKCKTVAEFISKLEATEFYSVLNNVFNENVTLFQLEMQLDLYYYMQLWKSKDKYLNTENKKIVHHLVGAEIDLQNIIWIYRLKTYYNTPPNMIYALLIPFHYLLKKDQTSRIVEARTTEELQREILETNYGKAFQSFDNIELDYYRMISKMYRSYAVMNPNSLAVALSYIFFKELELKNIITTMEGIRYGLDSDKIFGNVILTDKKGEG